MIRDRCKQGLHRHMSNNTRFMNFPIETAAAFPSRAVDAFPLTSTVQPSLDPLTVNDPWASAVAVRPVQQQHLTQMPFWPQLQGTEFWPQTGQPQQWSTPRSPLGLTGPPPTTLQGMPANDWQSPLPPPPTWDANTPGFGCGDSGRQDASLRPWLRELSFWRHDTSIPVNKQGVKLYKSLPIGTIGRSLADQFSEDQICSGQGFDLIIAAFRHHFRSYLEAEPEVQAEIALYNRRGLQKELLWNTRRESANCGGRLSCSAMMRSTSQTARFDARGRDTVQHDCDLWWNWHGQSCTSSGFPCWNRGSERGDAIPGARGTHVGRWKTTVHSTADTNHDYAPAGSKHPHER